MALCRVCDATLTLSKSTDFPYCKTEKCARAYVPILVGDRTHHRDGHVIWDGAYHRRTGRPLCRVFYGGGKSFFANPMNVLWEQAGGTPVGRGHALRRTCEEKRCIGPDHLLLGSRGGVPASPAPDQPRAPKVPVMPLVRLVASRGAEFDLPPYAYSAIKWAQEHTGQIDLYVADRICCDELNIHPYFVFGEAFYSATA